MAAALGPMFLATVFWGSAMADWLLRGPAEYCARRVQSGHLSVLLVICTLILLMRAGVLGARLAGDVFRSSGAVRAWRRSLPVSPVSGTVLPIEEPHAFVMGILKPQIFLSRGLLTAAKPDLLEPLLAHEEAHVRRRDPLRRLVASIGLLAHLPGVTRSIQLLLTRAQEMAADAEAVKQIGNGPRVAEALLWFARLRQHHSAAACEFAKVDVGARVRQILEPRQQPDGPSLVALLACCVGLTVFAAIARHQLHHLSEILLQLP
jgi:Zn-dependent protease with chaperone function